MGTKVIPREVGKLLVDLGQSRKTRYNLTFSESQKSFIVGTLLGDGCLIPNSWGKLYRLQIEHCIAQKEYVFWKYKILREFVLTEPRFQEQNRSWKFRTGSHPDFTELAGQFYDMKRHKKVPDLIKEYLQNPVTLSVWYMDDGGLRRERGKIYGAFLNTQSFSLDENKLLQEVLSANYGMETLLSINHGKPRISIPSRSLHTLRSIISPYLHDSMRYKLP